MKIHTIDLLFQGTPGIIAAYVVSGESGLCLIETGPQSCHQALLAGVEAAGFGWRDITDVFVTHIHLDHAGGAGWWAAQGKRLHVHPQGAPHLIDPSKLIASAQRIYGDRMQMLWGDIPPAPAAYVNTLQDGEAAQAGDLTITAWDTPGHARHHLAFSCEKACFTGDVAGVKLGTHDYLSVASAPPQFEIQPYLDSVERLRTLNFAELYLTHFGQVNQPEKHLQAYSQRLQQVYADVQNWADQGWDENQISQAYEIQQQALANMPAAAWQLYQLANGTEMSAHGLALAVRKARVAKA